jgi:hypothetical protein
MDSQNTIKPAFASSVNPSEISLFIKGLSFLVISIVGHYAVKYGYDVTTATTQAQAIVDVLVSATPEITAVISTGFAVWGLVRKVFVAK